MATFLNLKIKVNSVAELKAVTSKLFSLGYGIGSNREKNFWNTQYGYAHYNSVFAHDSGMILFGTPAQGWRDDSYDAAHNSHHTGLTVSEFLQ